MRNARGRAANLVQFDKRAPAVGQGLVDLDLGHAKRQAGSTGRPPTMVEVSDAGAELAKNVGMTGLNHSATEAREHRCPFVFSPSRRVSR